MFTCNDEKEGFAILEILRVDKETFIENTPNLFLQSTQGFTYQTELVNWRFQISTELQEQTAWQVKQTHTFKTEGGRKQNIFYLNYCTLKGTVKQLVMFL